MSFVHGLRMDLSAAGYLLLPVCLFVIASLYVPLFRKARPYRIYYGIVLFLVLLITLADLEVYRSWGFRIDATPLKYLSSPKEAWASVSHLPLWLIFIGFALMYITLYFTFSKFISRNIYRLEGAERKTAATVALVLFTAILIIPIRGGLQLAPMNQSTVYFSKENFANVTAVNATWNFLNGLAEGAPVKNKYKFFSQQQLARIKDSLFRSSNSTDSVLNTSNPNVILIIWESFTTKALEQEINGKPITPRFRELMKEGLYFNSIYASGDRTDKGVAAVLGGYPALNNASIIRYPKKSMQLTTLPQLFNERGYHTSFYYGGETEFANIKSFLLQNQYGTISDKTDFDTKDHNSKWGAHDGVVANRIFDSLAGMRQPFFTTWLTLSSHEPFETPVATVFEGNDHVSQFANSLHYTDAVVYDFIRRCEQQPWWRNTLVVIVADHGHTLLQPSDWIENFRIPMLWLGGALQQKGIVEKVASQTDLAQTLAAQLGNTEQRFSFSRNIFDTAFIPWAYFAFNNGFGFANATGAFAFDNIGKQLILQKGPVGAKEIEAGKAMQQATFQDFVDR